MPDRFELMLFTTDDAVLERASAAGVDAVIVDWERRGKHRRQAEADTQINRDTPDDLRRVRRAWRAHLVCRIDGFGTHSAEQIETAVDAGADEILLPMVRGPQEVESTLAAANGRCGVGILVETVSALTCARSLAGLPLTRAYLGLNDLAIERRTPDIFAALRDGTAERVREEIRSGDPRLAFGLGGLTLPDRGSPVPCRLLIGEMARLGCTFSFLRRSFLRDTGGRDLTMAVGSIREALSEARRRDDLGVLTDRLELERSGGIGDPADALTADA